MADKRDLEFFMSNPHELPGNLDELEAALAGAQTEGEGEGSTIETGEEVSAASGAVVDEKLGKAGEAGKAAATEGDPAAATAAAKDAEGQVILSKNGKHQIPYSVLETEREQRRAAEGAVEQLRQQIEALTAKVNGTAAPAAAAGEPEISEEDIEAIAGDFPATGKALRALLGQVQGLKQELETVRQSESTRQGREAQSATTTVQQAIDNNPTLSYLQANDPEMFAEAVKTDNQIKANPRNRGLTMEQRFDKVVSALEAVYGPFELPGQSDTTQTTTTAAPAPAAKNVAATAAKVVKEAEQGRRVGSLSDIPGGVPPEADELTQLGELSANDLGNKFMKMNLQDLSTLLARAA